VTPPRRSCAQVVQRGADRSVVFDSISAGVPIALDVIALDVIALDVIALDVITVD